MPPTVAEAAKPGEQDDFRLIRAVAAGDRRALEDLYDRHASLLLGVALAILRSGRPEAEDLLHDVFVEIWQHAGDYDPQRGSVRTWMTLRMRSRALDRIKSVGRSRTTSLEEAPVLDRQASPDDPSAAPDRRRVKEAMRELPVEQREVLELQYFEGLSSSEAAERLNVPIGTVKSRTAAALRKLGSALRSEQERNLV